MSFPGIHEAHECWGIFNVALILQFHVHDIRRSHHVTSIDHPPQLNDLTVQPLTSDSLQVSVKEMYVDSDHVIWFVNGLWQNKNQFTNAYQNHIQLFNIVISYKAGSGIRGSIGENRIPMTDQHPRGSMLTLNFTGNTNVIASAQIPMNTTVTAGEYHLFNAPILVRKM